MTDEQIRKLDRCRQEQMQLSLIQEQIRESFKSIGNNHNADLGSEIKQIFRDLKEVVSTSLGEAQSKINKLITEI